MTTDGGRSYTWLKWTAAGVLFVEGLIGVLVPVCMKLTVHAGWLMSLVNCFAGGVFFTFGEPLVLICLAPCDPFRPFSRHTCHAAAYAAPTPRHKALLCMRLLPCTALSQPSR